jgi:hypothetical protein
MLQTSAAYFANILATEPPPVRYTIYVGMEVSETMLQSLDSVQSIIEAIPVFTDLELKPSRKLMPLPSLSFWRPRPIYYTRRKRLLDSLNKLGGRPWVAGEKRITPDLP